MKRFIPTLVAFVMLISCMQGIVFADELTYGLSADTYVSCTQSTSSYGGNIELLLTNRGENAAQDRFGLIRIDLSEWANGEIDNVELGMYLYEGTDATTVVPGKVDFYKIEDNSWDEKTVTYATRPVDQGVLAGSADVTALNTWCTVDLTDAVKNDPDKILSFKVYSPLGVRYKFSSKDSTSNKPYVKVTGVKGVVPATGVTLSQNSLQLTTKSDPVTLTANVVPSGATNKNVTWSSSNTSVATVDNGLVTPVSEGTTQITATTEDGRFTDSCTVTVQDIHVTGVSLDKESLNLLKFGNPEMLTATVSPVDATNKNIIWSSSNTNVATVDNGLVTPVSEGEAVITVTTGDGNFTDTCNVVVLPSADKVYTYQVSDDTYYAGDEAGPNGSASYVYVRKSGNSRTGYMKFKMPELDGYNITDAKVYFQLNDVALDIPVNVKGFFDSNWTEQSASYKTPPDLSNLSKNALDTVTVNKAGYWYSMDITEYAKTVSNGVLSLQFSSDKVFQSGYNDKVYISSKESGAVPYVKLVARPFKFDDSKSTTFDVMANKLNSGSSPLDALLTACTFDKNGTLTKITADKQTINAGERNDFTAKNFASDYDLVNNYGKFFLIKSVTDPIPLTASYKYAKGCIEYPQSSGNIQGLIIDGNKITVKGKVLSQANVGLTVVKPNVDINTIDYSNLIGSLKHIGVSSTDEEGNYSFAFTMEDAAPEGLYTAYVGFNNGDAALTIPFLYVKDNGLVLSKINGASNAAELQSMVEPYAKFLGLDTSKIYINHYLTLSDDKRKEVLNNISQNIKSNPVKSISDVLQTTQSEISLYTVNTAATYKVIGDLIEVSTEFLSLNDTAKDKKGNTLSYASMYSKLKNKSVVSKAIYGNQYNGISAFEEEVKDEILKAHNGEITTPPTGGGGGGGGGSGKGITLQIGTITTPSPTPTPTPENFKFDDLKGFEWAANSIEKLAQTGKISTDTNTFNPGNDVTREEFVKMLIGGLGLTDNTAECSYDDVDNSDWYYDYVATAVKLDIVNGISDDSFGIGQKITRQDMATMVYRAAKSKALNLTDSENISFTDSNEISDYAKTAVETMQKTGIITGIEDGKFDPNGNTNRAQAAVIICRLLDL